MHTACRKAGTLKCMCEYASSNKLMQVKHLTNLCDLDPSTGGASSHVSSCGPEAEEELDLIHEK